MGAPRLRGGALQQGEAIAERQEIVGGQRVEIDAEPVGNGGRRAAETAHDGRQVSEGAGPLKRRGKSLSHRRCVPKTKAAGSGLL